MARLFEYMGTLMATACLVQIASDPARVLTEIRLGPVPSLVRLDQHLRQPTGSMKRKAKSGKNNDYRHLALKFPGLNADTAYRGLTP